MQLLLQPEKHGREKVILSFEIDTSKITQRELNLQKYFNYDNGFDSF